MSRGNRGKRRAQPKSGAQIPAPDGDPCRPLPLTRASLPPPCHWRQLPAGGSSGPSRTPHHLACSLWYPSGDQNHVTAAPPTPEALFKKINPQDLYFNPRMLKEKNVHIIYSILSYKYVLPSISILKKTLMEKC